jgi:hypothetical protein
MRNGLTGSHGAYARRLVQSIRALGLVSKPCEGAPSSDMLTNFCLIPVVSNVSAVACLGWHDRRCFDRARATRGPGAKAARSKAPRGRGGANVSYALIRWNSRSGPLGSDIPIQLL